MRNLKSYLRGLSAEAIDRASYTDSTCGRVVGTVGYFILGAILDAVRGY